MVANGVVHTNELAVAGEDGGGNVVDLAADEPAHHHVELEVHDVELRAGEEWLAGDVLLRVPGPGGQETRDDRLARGLLLGVPHPDRRRDNGAEVLDVLHHSFVARRLEVVGRVEAMAAADQHQDGIGVCERLVAR